MSENLTSAEHETISAIRSALPDYSSTTFEALSAGSMNKVFELVGEGLIIHTTPSAVYADEFYVDIIEPHAVNNKGAKIGLMYAGLNLPTEHSVRTASLNRYGEYEEQRAPQSFWMESKILGTPLNKTEAGLTVEDYAHLTGWISEIQQLNTPDGVEPLEDYYNRRIAAYKGFFMKHEDTALNPAFLSLLDSYGRVIADAVHPNERVSFVHGDLNSSNILVDETALEPEERIGVIDFEKSIFLGDPLADITKLLNFKHDYILPDPQYSYVPPALGSEDKKILLRQYAQAKHPNNSGVVENLEASRYSRDYLIHIDTTLSVLAYRLLNRGGKINNEDFLITYAIDLYQKTLASGVIHE